MVVVGLEIEVGVGGVGMSVMGVEVEEGGNGGGSIVDDGGVGMEGCCFYMGIEGVLWYLGLNGEWGL